MLSVAGFSLHAAMELATFGELCIRYGIPRVYREHLYLVEQPMKGSKPWIVSNGDVLADGSTFLHFIISCFLWILLMQLAYRTVVRPLNPEFLSWAEEIEP